MRLLLVEDDAIDAEFFQRMIQKHELQLSLTVAKNGIEALRILRNDTECNSMPPRWLIITDLHMPLMNGIEFLEELRADERLKHCIVFVMTDSDCEETKKAAYDLYTAGYLLKKNVRCKFLTLINMVKFYHELIW